MLKKGSEKLMDEINNALNDMDNDRTLSRLADEYISDKEPVPVDIANIDGGDTVRV